jgi:hypothetical protein
MKVSQIASEPHKSLGQLLPVCKLCGTVPSSGITGGYLIKGAFICKNCEGAIVKLEIGTDEYNYYMQQLKKLFK